MDTSWIAAFSPGFRKALRSALVDARGRRALACFDADQTLWAEDIGEALFRWLLAGDLLPRVAGRTDVWEDYEARCAQSLVEGYSYAVECMSGVAEADLTKWCRQMAAAWPNHRPAMIKLANGLSAAGFEVWIVSASNRWIVQASAHVYGIPPERVLGIDAEVRDAVLTDYVLKPVTCVAGKVEAIRDRIGRMPDVAFGDSLGDLPMLEASARPFVIGRRDRRTAKLLGIAAEREWPVHLF